MAPERRTEPERFAVRLRQDSPVIATGYGQYPQRSLL